jgi:hypothetical protein
VTLLESPAPKKFEVEDHHNEELSAVKNQVGRKNLSVSFKKFEESPASKAGETDHDSIQAPAPKLSTALRRHTVTMMSTIFEQRRHEEDIDMQ